MDEYFRSHADRGTARSDESSLRRRNVSPSRSVQRHFVRGSIGGSVFVESPDPRRDVHEYGAHPAEVLQPAATVAAEVQQR